MPLELGTVRGFKTRFHLYTVPGQVFYDASRKLILKGVDGVVFVADSQEERMDANIESLYNLEENLQANGYDLSKIPYVLQLNKRDLPNVIPADEMVVRASAQGRARPRGRRLQRQRRLRHAQVGRQAGLDRAAKELSGERAREYCYRGQGAGGAAGPSRPLPSPFAASPRRRRESPFRASDEMNVVLYLAVAVVVLLLAAAVVLWLFYGDSP